MNSQKLKLSRRAFGHLLAGSTLAAQAPLTREEELRAAQQRRQATAETLARFDLPPATEPAFLFRP